MRRAFTMVELIFSLVIMTVIAMIGSDVIRHIYETYAFSKQVESTQNDLRRTLDLIAARLSYRIKNSVIATKSDWSEVKAIDDVGIKGGEHTTLAWVGIAYESSRYNDGWSGVAKNSVNDSGDIDLTLYLSNFGDAKKIEDEFFRLDNSRVVFAGDDRRGAFFGDLIESFGYKNSTKSSYFKITSYSSDALRLKPQNSDSFAPVSEYFYLVRSAYAIRVDDGNLTLYHNFRPWLNEGINDASKTVLLENVKVFQFAQMGEVLRLSICSHLPKDSHFDAALKEQLFCRERSIF